ncbi:hypothetical protein GUJ93_ZPchr0012g20098 [Zizania palustris]|uniref:Uncharacterized protein n=1 Tax=Zizania palustris TaxID=103762 RepID=A0A8J5WMI9_ZIZPA|nr:hypothetical protein GUJ93_ZPchr0012g20098 [Zizania palustris]
MHKHKVVNLSADGESPAGRIEEAGTATELAVHAMLFARDSLSVRPEVRTEEDDRHGQITKLINANTHSKSQDAMHASCMAPMMRAPRARFAILAGS